MIKYIRLHLPNYQQAVIVSPDAGGAKRYVPLPLQKNASHHSIFFFFFGFQGNRDRREIMHGFRSGT